MKLLADENIDPRFVRSLLRREPSLDIVLARDAGLLGRVDTDLLQWASDQGRVIVTYDARTMPDFAYERLAAGLPMPGIIVLGASAPFGQLVEDLLIVVGASSPGELEGRVMWLPM